MITIYDTEGNIRYKTPINIGSKRVCKIMGDDYATIVFNEIKPVYFQLGDYCDIENFGRFELVEPYQPDYDASVGGYHYELRLDAQYVKWRNKIMRYSPLVGASETSWTLTATADVHLQQILKNINALCKTSARYFYNGIPGDWTMYIDWANVGGAAKTLTYESTNIIDALSQLAETYECEWWVNGNIVCLGRCESQGDYVDFESGVNVSEMSRSKSSEDYVTRLIVFGGERNVSPRYRKELIFDVKQTKDGGVLVSDTARVLGMECFPESLVQSKTETQTFSLTRSATRTLLSQTQADLLLHTDSETVGSLKAGEWTMKLSKFLPYVSFSDKNGGATAICRVTATMKDGTAYKSESAIALMLTDYEYVPSFEDIAFEVPDDNGSLRIDFYVYISMNGPGEITASVSPGDNSNIILQRKATEFRVSGLTMKVLDGSGNVARAVSDVVFNPEYKSSASERNWFRLPMGTLAEGERFMIAEILEPKVKSSYYTSRYQAYEDYGGVEVNGVVTNRLMLPEGQEYIDLYEGLVPEQAVEDVVIFEDVYPKAECTVAAVETFDAKEQVQNDDGSTTESTYTAFRIADGFFTSERPFKEEYKMPNKDIEITFMDGKRYEEGDELPPGKNIGDLIHDGSGKLNGMTFAVRNVEQKDGSTMWEIIRDDTTYIPNDYVRPEVGDVFAITGIDISVINEAFVYSAEEDLLKTAQRYAKKMNTDPSAYDCTMMADEETPKMGIGDRVNLINEAYMVVVEDESGRRWGRKSRIIGFELNLDIPYDHPIYTIGEKPAYSRFGAIEDKVDAMNYAMASGTYYGSASGGSGGTGNVYVIRQDDTTMPTDMNVYSALRSALEYTSRKSAQLINYLWTFYKGLRVGNYVMNNSGAKIDADGDAEVESIVVRKGARVGANVNIGGDAHIGGNTTMVGGAVFGSEFMPGSHGGAVWIDDLGRVHFETDFITAREKLEAKEIEIQEQTHVGGCQIISPAAMRCGRVIPKFRDGAIYGYKCLFPVSDEEGREVCNQFALNDLAKCQTFNLVKDSNGMMGNHYYWREVVEVGYTEENGEDYATEIGIEGFVVLSDEVGHKDPESGVPMAGDAIVAVGNSDDTKKDRQNLIMLASYGNGSPYIYQYAGIRTFALTKDNLKTAISPWGNLFTGKFIIENEGKETSLEDYVRTLPTDGFCQLVLTNEMAAVSCNSSGNPLHGLPTSRVIVYEGARLAIGWTFDVEATGCTATVENGEVLIKTLLSDEAVVTVTATKEGYSDLQKQMRIVKVLRGADGMSVSLVPDATAVVVGLNGGCTPERLGCGVAVMDSKGTYMLNERNIETAKVPFFLEMTYSMTLESFDVDRDKGTATPTLEDVSEQKYTGPIEMSPYIRSIQFRLYADGILVDSQTVVTVKDTAEMEAVFNTRFEVNEKSIDALSSRVSDYVTEVAEVRIMADGIKSSVEATANKVEDIIGGGRNLLLRTNQGSENWMYTSDSSSYEVEENSMKFIVQRYGNDAQWEVFMYKLRPELIKKGEKYTLSFMVKNNWSYKVQFYIQICSPDGNASSLLTDMCHVLVDAYSEQMITATLTAKETGVQSGTQVVYMAVVPESRNKWTKLSFWDIKLEHGSTATQYSVAPEDSQDYYNRSMSEIKQTADSITSTVREEVDNQVGGALSELKSEIQQTADSISMRVDRVIGVENLVTGNYTGIGWSFERPAVSNMAVIATPNKTTGVFTLTNNSLASSTSAKYDLKTSHFTLKANTKYLIHFVATGAGSTRTIVCLKRGNTTLASLEIAKSTPHDNSRYVASYETGASILENCYIVFEHLGNVSSTAGTSTVYISKVMVEEGSVLHDFVDNATGLLGTGIDITNGRIVFTSDNTVFQNSLGEQAMFIDMEGHIYSKYINADELVTRRLIAGVEDGERVEISPEIRGMNVFDNAGAMTASYNGATNTGGPSQMFGNSSSSTIINPDTVACSNDNDSTNTQTFYLGNMSNMTQVKIATGSMTAKLVSAGYTESNSSDASAQTLRPAQVSSAQYVVRMFMDIASDQSFTTGVRTMLLGAWGNRISSSDEDATYGVHEQVVQNFTNYPRGDSKGVSAGHYRVRIVTELSTRMAGSSATVSFTSLSVSRTSEFYVSNYFANGFCLGSSAKNYVTAYRDLSGKMVLAVESSSYGLRTNGNTLEYKHHGGNWQKMPVLLFHGNVYYDSNGAWHVAGTSFNGSNPTASWDSAAQRTVLTWPSTWNTLNMSNSTVIVSLTPGEIMTLARTTITSEGTSIAATDGGTRKKFMGYVTIQYVGE